MKVIETRYNGYRFRSRLEARWAVFFDAAGIDYRYEPEGFELECYGVNEGDPDGIGTIRYLPDFYLPDFRVFAEVKPPERWTPLDRQKVVSAADYGALGSATDNGGGDERRRGAQIILLGEIPLAGAYPIVPVLHHHKGIAVEVGSITDDALRYDTLGTWWVDAAYGEKEIARVLDEAIEHCRHLESGQARYTQSRDGRPPRKLRRVTAACDAARQARFEFGETPRVGASR